MTFNRIGLEHIIRSGFGYKLVNFYKAHPSLKADKRSTLDKGENLVLCLGLTTAYQIEQFKI